MNRESLPGHELRRSRATVVACALALLGLTLFFDERYLTAATTAFGEEHFQLGEHLYATGVLSIDDAPAFFRPPGFPIFVATVLHLRDALSSGIENRLAVTIAHGVLLSLGALALFLYFSRDHSLPMAFGAGALYAFHPLGLVIARSLTYPTLHVACITFATLAVSRALAHRQRRALWALAAGALWGATTLVRPVSLILPPFILLLARWNNGAGSWRRSLSFTVLFTAGMALVIGPYTVRNYRLSHRLIVVNAQEGFAFWALSATRNPGGDGAAWNTIWREEGEPLFNRVSGSSAYSIEALYAHSLALNDAFRAEAARNIRSHPARFAANLVRNVGFFNADAMSWWIDQAPGGADPRTSLGARVVTVATLLLGLAGILRGLREGNTHARVVVTVYVMFCVAHSLGLMLARYNYVRLPLALLAIPLAFGYRGLRSGAPGGTGAATGVGA